MINRRLMLGLLAASPLLARPALSAPRAVVVTDDMAIGGYDPVAYFTVGSPVKGTAEHALIWKGAVWRFDNAAHREAFEMNPASYAPQYGGYCAFAMARRSLSSGDPHSWAIFQDKLYLTATRANLVSWTADIPHNVEMADANWHDLLFG